jgi:hypothetical protein
MEPEGSLSHPQDVTTCTYPDPDQSSGLFYSGFPTNNPYAFFPPPIRATCSFHFIILDLIILIIFGQDYRSLSSSLRSFLHPPVTPSLFGPNVLLDTVFSNSLSLCSTLNVRLQLSKSDNRIKPGRIFCRGLRPRRTLHQG